MTIAFTPLLDSIRTEDGGIAVDVPDDWLQGRTVFGGLQAAIALRAMRALVADAPLRTIQATFFAPVPAGTVHARARILRSGKNATHVEATLVDGDATLALLVGVFGASRESTVTFMPQQPPLQSTRAFDFAFIPGITPSFTRHFGVRWLRGQPPYTGDTQTSHVLEVSLRDAGPATEAHVLAIADFIPPIPLSMLKKPAPGATMTWMLEMLADRVDHLPLERWRVDATLAFARDGYIGQSVMLWGPGGETVAMSRQSMVVFG
jgi:hypothetical protein